VAVFLTLEPTKQIRINIHKRNNTKNTVQTIQNTVNTRTHITKTPTQLSKHPHITKQVKSSAAEPARRQGISSQNFMATLSRRSCTDCTISTRHFAVIEESPRHSAERYMVKCDVDDTGNVEGIFGKRYHFEWIVVVHTVVVTHLVFGRGFGEARSLLKNFNV
jgi:hypothetical protein